MSIRKILSIVLFSLTISNSFASEIICETSYGYANEAVSRLNQTLAQKHNATITAPTISAIVTPSSKEYTVCIGINEKYNLHK